ncbi:MAG: hypothetical protein O3B24_05790 [Verrucomicrobia bacterium]|nr:hypothetical protein [Verrucomicrobiota bacterium]
MRSSRRAYEIVFDAFNRRWNFKPQGLPGPLKVARTREAVTELAIPICNHQSCTLKIYTESGQLEEERSFGKPTAA